MQHKLLGCIISKHNSYGTSRQDPKALQKAMLQVQYAKTWSAGQAAMPNAAKHHQAFTATFAYITKWYADVW